MLEAWLWVPLHGWPGHTSLLGHSTHTWLHVSGATSASAAGVSASTASIIATASLVILLWHHSWTSHGHRLILHTRVKLGLGHVDYIEMKN